MSWVAILFPKASTPHVSCCVISLSDHATDSNSLWLNLAKCGARYCWMQHPCRRSASETQSGALCPTHRSWTRWHLCRQAFKEITDRWLTTSAISPPALSHTERLCILAEMSMLWLTGGLRLFIFCILNYELGLYMKRLLIGSLNSSVIAISQKNLTRIQHISRNIERRVACIVKDMDSIKTLKFYWTPARQH